MSLLKCKIVGLVALVSLLAVPKAPSANGPSPEEVVSKHLQSLGSADARAAAKSRVVEGGATYRLLVGGSGAIDGKAAFVSEGLKSHVLLKINATGFNGEQFVSDGNRSSVAGTYNDKSRSEMGEFVRTQDIVLREGLFGGVWSTGWPLLDMEGRKAKLSSEGTKKFDGQELQVYRYHPKKGTDLEILVYFDSQFRHVMTTYRYFIRAGIATSDLDTPRKQESRFRLEERFSDFQTPDGLTLPRRYDLRFTEELDNGFTKSVEWEVAATRILTNVSLDPRNFEVK